jgi:hypothetical protein
MKKSKILLIFLLLLAENIHSQYYKDYTKLYLCESDVYMEDKPYKIYICTNDEFDSITVIGDKNALILNDSNKTKIVVFHGEPYKSTLTVFGYKDGIRKHVITKEFPFQPKPLKAWIGSPFGTAYSCEYMEKKGFYLANVYASLLNFNISLNLRAESFRMIYYDNKGKLRQINGNYKITDEMYEEICKLSSGQFVIFDNITVKNIYDFLIKVPPIIVFIK